MFMMKGALALFISLAIGYGICVLANKQKKGLLQTVGYTLGTGVVALSLLYSAMDNCAMAERQRNMPCGCESMKHHAGMFMKGHAK